MWIVLNHAFLSVVASDKEADKLAVRARAKGDIERVFPGAKVFAWRGRDYAYRAFISRERVAMAIAQNIAAIRYTNFKSSVAERDRADAYHDLWDVMADFQADRGHGAPYRTHMDPPRPRGRDGFTPRRSWPTGRRGRRARQAELDDLFGDPLREPDYDDGWPLDLPEPRGSIHGLTDDQFREVYGEKPIPPLDGRRRRR